MSGVDFRNTQEAGDRLEDRYELHRKIAARSLTRVLALCGFRETHSERLLLLKCFRCHIVIMTAALEKSAYAQPPVSPKLSAGVAMHGVIASGIGTNGAARLSVLMGFRDGIEDWGMGTAYAVTHSAEAAQIEKLDAARVAPQSVGVSSDATGRKRSGVQHTLDQNIIEAANLDSEHHVEQLDSMPVWSSGNVPDYIKRWDDRFNRMLSLDEHFSFWHRWHAGISSGKFSDWDLAIEVAKIPDEFWEGEDALSKVAREIERIEAEFRSDSGGSLPPNPKEVQAIKQRLELNRDALAASSAGLLEQLAEFRDRIRGLNSLDPDLRDEILAFADGLYQQLETLLNSLPMPDEQITEEVATGIAIWLRGYWKTVKTKMVFYGSYANVGEATVPTSIILGATGIGAMVGQPLAGAAVGGLIANQMKPGQAAKDIMKPTKDGGE
ncbi:MAG: hypothetical protein AAF822_02790 [Pseudomonadota bacterium]